MGVFSKKIKPGSEVHVNNSRLKKLDKYPHGVRGSISLLDKPFHFHDAKCFYDSYKEIVNDEVDGFNVISEKVTNISIRLYRNITFLLFLITKNY